MVIDKILITVYIVVGVILSYYWHDKEYANEYKSMIEDGIEVEKGMVAILMLCMAIFWPIKVIKNLIIKNSI